MSYRTLCLLPYSQHGVIELYYRFDTNELLTSIFKTMLTTASYWILCLLLCLTTPSWGTLCSWPCSQQGANELYWGKRNKTKSHKLLLRNNFFIVLTTKTPSAHCSHLITFHPEYHRQVAHVRQVSASNLIQVPRCAEVFRFLIDFPSPSRQVGVRFGDGRGGKFII